MGSLFNFRPVMIRVMAETTWISSATRNAIENRLSLENPEQKAGPALFRIAGTRGRKMNSNLIEQLTSIYCGSTQKSERQPRMVERREHINELDLKRKLIVHQMTGEPDGQNVVGWLQDLSQALESQRKFDEALKTRLRARNLLIDMMYV
jgi:hypothetical protein